MNQTPETVPGTMMANEVIPAGGGWSRVVDAGATLRIIDLEGKQAVDFLVYDAHDPLNRYAAADTMKINAGGIFLTTGTVLYSVLEHPLMTITHDTCGRHDTIGGCCSNELNAFRYGAPPDTNCRDTFLGELAKHGLGPRDMVANINFFMYVPVSEDGAMDMGPSISKPGDYVDLRAEREVLALISNCAQINNAVNDYNPTPVRAIIWRPA